MKTFLEYNQTDIDYLDTIVEELVWEDIFDLYDDNELVLEDEELEEAISATQRLKRAQKMRAMKTRLSQARKLKLARASTNEVIKQRAKTAARRMLIKKFLKGRSKDELSAQEKDRLEKLIKNMPAVVSTLQQKLVPKVRQIERSRMSKAKKK